VVSLVRKSGAGARDTRLHFLVKNGDLGSKTALFGLKMGQNQGFAVTDSLT
jgi:hypothetical protein